MRSTEYGKKNIVSLVLTKVLTIFRRKTDYLPMSMQTDCVPSSMYW